MIFAEPIEYSSLLKILHQMIRCCYFSKTQNIYLLDCCLESFQKHLLHHKLEFENIVETLDLLLTGYKMGMMLYNLKDHKVVAEIINLVLSHQHSYTSGSQFQQCATPVNHYLGGMISLLLKSDEYLKPALELLNCLKKSQTSSWLDIMEKYVYCLCTSTNSLDYEKLKDFFDCLCLFTKKTNSILESTVIISKTFGIKLSKVEQLDSKTTEMVLNIIGKLIQVVRTYDNKSGLNVVENVCKECNDVKRHLIIKLVNYVEKIIESVGKAKALTKRNLDKFVSLVEYVLTVAVDGLKCSNKKPIASNFLVFIYNMVVTWKFFGKLNISRIVAEIGNVKVL